MKPRTVTPAGKLTVIGLASAAAGIWIQALSGVPEYPTIPPGPIILVAVALVIAAGSRYWRWLPVLGTFLSALITVGAFVRPGTANRLSDPAMVGAFAGTLIQMLALIITIPAGVVATVRNYGKNTV